MSCTLCKLLYGKYNSQMIALNGNNNDNSPYIIVIYGNISVIITHSWSSLELEQRPAIDPQYKLSSQRSICASMLCLYGMWT